MDALEAAPIREEVEYGGVRVRTTATIAGARIPIQVDIGFGDAVTPVPVDIEYPSLLDAPAPHLRAYPVAAVVAEKFEAMVTLGMANSRLKDFYDLWLIAETFELERSALTEAVQQTFTRRRTDIPKESNGSQRSLCRSLGSAVAGVSRSRTYGGRPSRTGRGYR
ncbi:MULTISPECIES: nucleotidyl transferase AbiEii/AbiGii toxin family protein [Mesorhizobium]|uniref:nucleotidyl transferase AbiEii/AbiGii toxin family protein n=1 Tax=Mesorhizobium TaxID=68287 RepID=UPI0028AF6A92|nr:nucleotidyl transferase AbiEii/AbiGii toxin family protein [Mesorhizobium zhangyense]